MTLRSLELHVYDKDLTEILAVANWYVIFDPEVASRHNAQISVTRLTVLTIIWLSCPTNWVLIYLTLAHGTVAN